MIEPAEAVTPLDASPQSGLATPVLVLRCSAPATSDNALLLLRKLASDPARCVGAPILVDAREGSFLPTPEQAHVLASVLAAGQSLRSHRVAFVVGQVAQFGLARMVCTLAELQGARAGAFTDERSAVAWLEQAPAAGE